MSSRMSATAPPVRTAKPAWYICSTNVAGLHLIGCCPGHAENRKFQQLFCTHGAGRRKTYYVDPYTHHRIYLVSDPSHLIKKLRNNVRRSGSKPWHTQNFKHYDRVARKWRTMRWKTFEVLHNDCNRSGGIKRFARLTEDHIYLTSRSLMRVGLALDGASPPS